MKTKLFIIALSLGLFSLTGCKKDHIEPETTPPIVLNAKQAAVVKASNQFGFQMLNELNTHTGDSNLCLSPLSISAALGMTWNGAAGNTALEMQNTLGFAQLTSQEINESYQVLLQYLLSSDPKSVLEIANSIWHRQDFYVVPDFIQRNQQYFGADVMPADFNDPATVDQINNWVSTHTHGKIQQIIDIIDPMTVMYLINATYFKGEWTYRFDEKNTFTGDFTLPNGSSIQVDMMKQKADMETLSTQLVRGVRMPYGNGRFQMVAVMPVQGKTLQDVVDQLDDKRWDGWMSSFEKTEGLDLYFPKFKFEYEESLLEMLHTLGIQDALVPGIANFSGINPSMDLYISDVKHKTFIDVNEKGTEAAAVTAVEIGYTSVGPMISFNQPFLFFITEKHTGFVIFSGKVVHPTY